MHPNVEEAIDSIDAAFFSSDTFHDEESLGQIKRMLARWQKEVVEIEHRIADGKEGIEPEFEDDAAVEARLDQREREEWCGRKTDKADAPTMAIDGFQLGGGIPPGKLVVLGGKATRTFPLEGNGTFLDECNYGTQETT